MKTFGIALLAALIGYVAGVLVGALLVSLGSNRHDRSTEAAMTAFFAVGPAFAVLAFIGTLIYRLH